MRPVATLDQLREADRRRVAEIGLERLVDDAGYALAMGARRALRSTAGRRVAIWTGPGLNGADGRAAAAVLRRLGAAVTVLAFDDAVVPAADLVLDCGVGTGVARPVRPPRLEGSPLVVACDLPSGLDPTDGTVHGTPWVANATVTMGALKAGLCSVAGRRLGGAVTVAPLGLDLVGVETYATEPADLVEAIVTNPDRHKWTTAVGVVAGSPGMEGAAALVANGAMRSGAGMVRVLGQGTTLHDAPTAVVLDRTSLDPRHLVAATARCGALVLGPGLGTSSATSALVRTFLLASPSPVVLDADGLGAFGDARDLAGILERRPEGAPTLLTPHDGEYRALMGAMPTTDRLESARRLASATGATVLLKGPTTAVVAPRGGEAYLVVDAPATLATAGSGDVLAGVCGTLLARSDWSATVARRAALAATWHAEAGRLANEVGCLSSDLPVLLAEVGSRWSVRRGG